MTSPVIPADFTILARNLLLSGVYCTFVRCDYMYATVKKKLDYDTFDYMYVYIHVCRPAGQAVIPVTVIRPSAEPTYALSSTAGRFALPRPCHCSMPT